MRKDNRTMKAAVMHEVARPLEIESVPVPEISPNEVLVETHSCGICGTDLHILNGYGYVPALPHILGHEPAGVVAAVGSDIKNLQVGDHVVPHLFFNCNHCYFCRAGRQQQCTNLKGILGVLVPGAFAEYFKAPAANLFRLPDRIPFDMGGLLADAVITSVHAFRRSALRLGETGVVIGVGGVGLTLIQILKAAGVHAIAVDRSSEHLELAKELGADMTLLAGDRDASSQIKNFTDACGAQCVFNCVGTSQTMRDSAEFVMRCGRIVVIGEEADYPSINTTEIAQSELEIIGSRNGTRQDLIDSIRFLAEGVVNPPIAKRFPLDAINEAFDFVRHGALGRVVITIKD